MNFFQTNRNSNFVSPGHGDVEAIVNKFSEGQELKSIKSSVDGCKKSANKDEKVPKKYQANWIVQFLYLTKRNMINRGVQNGFKIVRL